MNKTRGHLVRWTILCAFIAGGILSGIVIDRVWLGIRKKPQLVEKREGGYTFINPLLECDGGQEMIGDQEVRPFRRKIEAYIEDAMRKRRAYQVSVYFRDLTNGPSFGVNENVRFAPASLLKVPLMIAYFKMAEARPRLLKEQLVYDGSIDRNRMENFKAATAIEPGKRYTIGELIEMMIAYSDNNATDLLLNRMDPGFLDRVYQDLGIIDPIARAGDDFIDMEEYTSCFRVLFNSSYLSRDLSERALRYLAQPDFPYGIRGSVPPGITVAQKYGERVFEATSVRDSMTAA